MRPTPRRIAFSGHRPSGSGRRFPQYVCFGPVVPALEQRQVPLANGGRGRILVRRQIREHTVHARSEVQSFGQPCGRPVVGSRVPVGWSLSGSSGTGSSARGWANRELEPDCSFWMRMPSVENVAGPRSRPPSKRNTATSSGIGRCLQDHGAQLAHGPDQFRSQGPNGFGLLHLGMQGRGGFEFEISGGFLALRAQGHQPALAPGGQELLHGMLTSSA